MQMLLRSGLVLLGLSCARGLDNGVGLVPASGWSSWNVFASAVTAADVMSMADVLVEKGLDKLGYEYVAIDCGWNLGERVDLQKTPRVPHLFTKVSLGQFGRAR